MEILLRRTWSGEKELPLQFPGVSLPDQGESGFLTEDFLSEPDSDGKSTDLGLGVENEPDVTLMTC